MSRFSPTGTGRALRPALLGVGLALAWWVGDASPVQGQNGDWVTLPSGVLRLGVRGQFLSADERFGAGDGTETQPLGGPLLAGDGTEIFSGTDQLGTALATVLGNPAYAPRLGSALGYLQSSQSRTRFSIEAGITSWLTVGVGIPVLLSRLEGDIPILPDSLADVGVNPAFTAPQAVEAFTSALSQAAGQLTGPEAQVWQPWAAAWVEAYRASALFPAQGSATAADLLLRLNEFNQVLAAQGIGTIGTTPVLAADVLDAEGLESLLFDPFGPFRYERILRPYLVTLGDVELDLRLRLLDGPPLEGTGRSALGLVALGTVRLGTGLGIDPDRLYDRPLGDGQLDVEVGGAGWIRTARFGIGGSVRYTLPTSGEVTRRAGSLESLIVPANFENRYRWTPGRTLDVDIRPDFSPAPGLFIEGRYRYLWKRSDTYTRLTPPLDPVSGPIPFTQEPSGAGGAVLSAGSSMKIQTFGGGLRFHPPEGGFPIEAWAAVESVIAGDGVLALRNTRLELGARLTRRLWGRSGG